METLSAKTEAPADMSTTTASHIAAGRRPASGLLTGVTASNVFGVAMLGVGFVLGLVELVLRIAGNAITPATIVLVAVLVIAGLQMTLFAMWFDMEANKDLR